MFNAILAYISQSVERVTYGIDTVINLSNRGKATSHPHHQSAASPASDTSEAVDQPQVRQQQQQHITNPTTSTKFVWVSRCFSDQLSKAM